MKKLLIAAAVVIGVAAAGAALAAYFVALAPNTALYEEERGVKIPPGSNFEAALDSLESAGIVGSRTTLSLFGRLTGWGGQVKAGYYTFESGASNRHILDVLRRGLQSPIRMTLPPGVRRDILSAVAGSVMAFERAAFDSLMKDQAFLSGLGADTATIIGYMLPETYFFYWLTSPERVIAKVKEEFDAFYVNQLADAPLVGEFSKEEIANLAAIVEWETGHEEEKARVAGVYVNRIRRGMPLQADPTVQYAVLAREGAKRRLLFVDYQIQHPYNTYLFRGLPPGPITNPSPSSLRAVANAESHDYLYFVSRGDGTHVFSRTLQEHNRAAQEYYRLMRERRRAQEAAAAGS